MPWETILLDLEAPLAIITLNRPQALNAMSRQMVFDLAEAFEQVESDPEIRALLITGSPRPDGRPCFSAGADLKEAGPARLSPAGEPLRHTMDAAWEVAQATGPRNDSTYNRLFGRLETMRTPSICVIDGICTTGGLELALSCDLRVVAHTAQISDWHIKNLGVIGGAGVTTRLPQLIGAARAKDMMWTGRPINGEEAAAIGLADRVFPSEELMSGAKGLAKTIASMSPVAISASKAVIDASVHQGPMEGIRYAQLWSALIALQREADGAPHARPNI